MMLLFHYVTLYIPPIVNYLVTANSYVKTKDGLVTVTIYSQNSVFRPMLSKHVAALICKNVSI